MSHVLPENQLTFVMKLYNTVCFATVVTEVRLVLVFFPSFLARHLELYFLSGEYSLRISAGLDVSNTDINRLLKKV